MRKILGRRSAALAGTVCALLIGMTGAANAEEPIYSNDGPVNVRITGGEALALNTCIADARDGVINTATVQCNQIATAGNVVELEDVSLTVYPDGTWRNPYLYRGRSVDAWISGGSAMAVNECIADAHDGVINTATVECAQVAVAGNMVMAYGVGINVYE